MLSLSLSHTNTHTRTHVPQNVIIIYHVYSVLRVGVFAAFASVLRGRTLTDHAPSCAGAPCNLACRPHKGSRSAGGLISTTCMMYSPRTLHTCYNSDLVIASTVVWSGIRVYYHDSEACGHHCTDVRGFV